MKNIIVIIVSICSFFCNNFLFAATDTWTQQASKTLSAYTIDTKNSKLSIDAKDVSLHTLLREIGKKTGIQVVIHDEVADTKVTISEDSLSFTSIPGLLNKLGVTNSAIIYDKKKMVMALYLLPVGKSISDLLQSNPFLVQLADSTFPSGQYIHTVKGKPIVVETTGKNNVATRYVQNDVLLKFHLGTPTNEINDLLNKYQLTKVTDENLAKIGYIKAILPTNTDVKQILQAMEKESCLKNKEFNFVLNTMAVSSSPSDITDPLYGKQWYIPDTRFDVVYPYLKQTNPISVAVIDSGIDTSHPDLRGKILPGYDFIQNTNTPKDDHGHGTFVAGIIAANVNSIGIRGLYDYAQIMPVKVVDSNGLGTYEDVAKGIIWAADYGAKVLNMSIGGYAYSYLLRDAVNYALGQGCLVVAAGGNDGIEQATFPAAYPDVIGVSALSRSGSIWQWSNHGRHIAVAAPGDDIISTGINNGYISASGTSASTAMVSSLAAMLAAERPDISSSTIARLIQQSARDLGEKGRDRNYGAGEIDAQAALGQQVMAFHDVAIRSVNIESTHVKKNENIYIVATIQNTGTYPIEDFTATLYEIIDGKKSIIETVHGTVVQNKIITFKYPANIIGSKIQYEVSLTAAEDINAANNIAQTREYNKTEKGTVIVLYANDPPVHGWIALQAYKVLVAKYGVNSAIIKEFTKYLPTDESDSHYFSGFSISDWTDGDYNENEVGAQETALIEGAFEEDGHLNFALDVERTKNHFWEPDEGFNYGLIGFNSALYTAINGPSRFGSAIVNYNPQSADNRLSFYWLGRTAHLLMDMTVPDHVHNDQHLTDISSYEAYTATQFRNVTSNNLMPFDIASLPLTAPSTYTETMPYFGDGEKYKDSKL